MGGMNAGSSPPSGSARETFLNYFFGQNGPGPIAGSSVERAQHGHHLSGGGGPSSYGAGAAGMMGMSGGSDAHQIVPVGRDVSGADSGLSGGLMAGKRGMDGNSAAYDMKSLGRHIEAVSLFHRLFSGPCCFFHRRAKSRRVDPVYFVFCASLSCPVVHGLLTLRTTYRSPQMARR